jgi:hypothetical protein
MKLLKSVLYEQHATQLVDLTLKEIIAAGKVTNPYQLFVLGHVSQFLKDGCKSVDLYLENPISFDSGATSTVLKDALLAMSDADHVKLATYLIDCMAAGESMLHDRSSNVIDWMKFVLRKQA